ncbi:hypothetical protein Rsub_10986 [Raphidocelis subcapitata]|uniref:Uncharacterized protein n=1 Tax=Raphidocelis subcapitata TaxID=307507 RepID=A0A2V0PK04_9CHLO|nr:hypothetical protein Rsub_10986 [Raphidocelis subcapitata]|eukprot:GBF98323.1 hypothetical protein Rsub_10986 [Raphidocelis subcapitata]
MRSTAFTRAQRPSAPAGVARPRTSVVRRAERAGIAPAEQNAWTKFVEGEWEGVTASFGPDGAPQPLPERFVPDAYREWGVELFDWQTQCSATTGAGGNELRSTLRRLMPTVGCEADAVAFTEDATTSATAAAGAPAAAAAGAAASEALAWLPDGSYSVGPASFDPEEASKLRFESCFAMEGLSLEGAPATPPAAGGAPRYRLKVAQVLARNWADGSWRVASVELHRERYEGPFTGRKELAGCGGGQPAISKLAPTPPDQIFSGGWAAEGGVVLEAAPNGGLAPAPAAGSGGAPFGGGGAAAGGGGAAVVETLLPLGAWSVVAFDGPGALRVEAGALSADGARRQVASRSYAAGAVARVAVGVDRRA